MANGTETYSWAPPLIEGGISWVRRESDGAMVPCDLANMDYQAFLAWVAAGNPAPEGWTGPTNPPEPRA